MPNWCSNELRVSGPAEDVARFKQQALGHNPWNEPEKEPSPLNFHSLVPIPAEVFKAGYANCGHDWEVKHWGARWGACDVQVVVQDEEYIFYHFDTAWSPAAPFIENVSKLWPTLQFVLDYEETGEGYKGICKGKADHFENHCFDI